MMSNSKGWLKLGLFIASQQRAIIIQKSNKTKEEASHNGKLWEGKYMRKLMEDKGQLIRFVCVIPSPVIRFLSLSWYGKWGWGGDTFTRGTYILLSGRWGRANNSSCVFFSTAFNTTYSYARMSYFRLAYSKPLQVKVGIQSEGPRSTLSMEPKQIMLSIVSSLSPQMFIQIMFVYQEQQRRPCRGKVSLKDGLSSNISNGRDRWGPGDLP